MSVFMQPIYTQTVGAGGAGAITFNNIPQGYQDLKVKISGRGAALDYYDAAFIRINGDTSQLYSDQVMFGQGSSVTTTKNSYGASGAVMLGYVAGANATANTFGYCEFLLGGYSGGNTKQMSAQSGISNSSTSSYLLSMSACLYRSTAPVTSLTLLVNSGTWLQNTTVTLYGIASKYVGNLPTAPTITSVTDQAGFVAVDFAMSATDDAQLYAVTGSDSVTTYSSKTPVITPVTVGTGTTFTAKTINAYGTSASTASASVTSYNGWSSIATVTSTGSLQNVVFGNIPQHYSHLQLRIFARSARAAANDMPYMRFNNDSGSNYYFHNFYGDGTGVYASAASDNVIYCGYIPAASATSGIFGFSMIDIYDYSNKNKFKTAKVFSGYDANGSGIIAFPSTYWGSYAPISKLFLANYFTAANFAAGTVFALYGMA